MAAIAVLLAACSTDDSSLEVSDPWVRAAPPKARMLAGYGRLVNEMDRSVSIVSFSSPGFGSVELHETVVEEGVARMRSYGVLDLAPGESATFRPGGLHLMLMRPVQPLKLGDSVLIQVLMASGESISVAFPVRAG